MEYLQFCLVFFLLIAIIFIWARLSSSLRKARERFTFSLLSLQALQARAELLREQTNIKTDLNYFRKMAPSSVFGPATEALSEILLNKTFTSRTNFDDAHESLVTHYCWHLKVLKFLLEDWVGATPTQSGYRLPEAIASTMDNTLNWLLHLSNKHSLLAERTGLSNSVKAWNHSLFEWTWTPDPSNPGRGDFIEVHCDPTKLQAEIDRLSMETETE